MAHREDYETAYQEFRWPYFASGYNRALERFDHPGVTAGGLRPVKPGLASAAQSGTGLPDLMHSQ